VTEGHVFATAPWWTLADDAELDLLVHEFIRAAFAHRADCETCRGGRAWCGPLADAFEGVLEWRRGRVLRSRAAWLRELQDTAGEASGLAA
jgi:hypothetical protein